jgi:hypothetical protein
MRGRVTKRYMSVVKALYGSQSDLDNNPSLPSITKRSSRSKPTRSLERGLQRKLVAWARGRKLPLLAIPNEGKRSRIEGHQQKLLGLWPGASDLFLAKRSLLYGGYFIEMKAPGERPRENQLEFMEIMRSNGYKAWWFDDWEKARDSIELYLRDAP